METVIMQATLILLVALIAMLWFLPVKKGNLPVEMRSSSVHGRGMFASEHIPKGTIIERAPLIPIDRDDDLTPNSLVRQYDIGYRGGKHAVMLGYASIYNHSDNNNASWDFEQGDDIIFIKATRDISPQEEVFVNYGPAYWIGKKASEKKG